MSIGGGSCCGVVFIRRIRAQASVDVTAGIPGSLNSNRTIRLSCSNNVASI